MPLPNSHNQCSGDKTQTACCSYYIHIYIYIYLVQCFQESNNYITHLTKSLSPPIWVKHGHEMSSATIFVGHQSQHNSTNHKIQKTSQDARRAFRTAPMGTIIKASMVKQQPRNFIATRQMTSYGCYDGSGFYVSAGGNT